MHCMLEGKNDIRRPPFFYQEKNNTCPFIFLKHKTRFDLLLALIKIVFTVLIKSYIAFSYSSSS